ncbi:MAG: hypothetical protein R3286_08335 [Gammaproteobacteria bacterium]|nr:hypothetical protein [Gammaproteobacteria bacterium]
MHLMDPITDYETLCAVTELEEQIDLDEVLIEALESDADPVSLAVASELKERTRRARGLVSMLCEPDTRPRLSS